NVGSSRFYPNREATATRIFHVMVISGVAWAQAPGSAGGRRGANRGAGYMSPFGEVAAISAESITIKNRRGDETVVPLTKNVTVNTLKPVQLSDIKEPKWATAIAGPTRENPEANYAYWVTIAAKMPEKPEAKSESAPTTGTRNMMRGPQSGVLTVEGEKATLKQGEKTMSLQFTERSRIFMQTPIKIDGVKVGDNVMLESKMVEGKRVVTGIDIMPPGQPMMGGGPRPGARRSGAQPGGAGTANTQQ
ncbi:MAG: hypothetical protein M1457_01740, partial [bacterium]|nr:hypothetical protein [bacterium]